MHSIKTGKEEIIYLLTKAISKYKLETGQEIVLNTNRKNYESLAIVLSEISNQLPLKFAELGADSYGPDITSKALEYPHRKFDITGGQIKDALSGIVSNPRPFLVDACYIYLYGIGRKAFKQNPVDENLLEITASERKEESLNAEKNYADLKQQILFLENQNLKKRKDVKTAVLIIAVLGLISILMLVSFLNSKRSWQAMKKDMNILPYQPTKAEIDSLEGVWLCYTGSPQARISDPARYHKVVSNVIEIKYKDGYFSYNRFGASFNHIGFMQFESSGIVSVYSRIKNNSDNTESPRHSLLNLNTGTKYLAAISASWNFDVGTKNKIIGIREIYIKLGKGGTLEEVLNEIENASCQCKVIRWHQTNNQVRTFYLRNQILDSLDAQDIKPLINENSILLGLPEHGLIISKDSVR
jgi:hypothetical protein